MNAKLNNTGIAYPQGNINGGGYGDGEPDNQHYPPGSGYGHGNATPAGDGYSVEYNYTPRYRPTPPIAPASNEQPSQ